MFLSGGSTKIKKLFWYLITAVIEISTCLLKIGIFAVKFIKEGDFQRGKEKTEELSYSSSFLNRFLW